MLISENRRMADVGNGYYQNPILGGNYPDPSVVRVGSDFYMTHSSFVYGPGLLIWHSRDLVNWKPVCHAIETYHGNIWAPDLIYYNEIFYIYFYSDGTNWVITSKSPLGKWSEPIDLKVKWLIDPGHVADNEGNRYLYFSGGQAIALAQDGLSIVGEIMNVYSGWKYPDDWVVEGFSLEGPKLIHRDGYFYLLSAQGGTAGPATSHMVVCARSKEVLGPWENSPFNPIIHTESDEELWWSQGHGSFVDTPDGSWWMMYHGYEKEFHTLGRQTLLAPIEWTDSNWPILAIKTREIKKPCEEKVTNPYYLTDSFSESKLGLQWQFFKEFDIKRFEIEDCALHLKSKGNWVGDSSPMLCIPTDRSYEIQVKLKLINNSEGGLILFYNEKCFCGIGLSKEGIYKLVKGYSQKYGIIKYDNEEVYFRLQNQKNVVTLFYSEDGEVWRKIDGSILATGYNHNNFDNFLSLRAGVYSFGEGKVIFKDFRYKAIN